MRVKPGVVVASADNLNAWEAEAKEEYSRPARLYSEGCTHTVWLTYTTQAGSQTNDEDQVGGPPEEGEDGSNYC